MKINECCLGMTAAMKNWLLIPSDVSGYGEQPWWVVKFRTHSDNWNGEIKFCPWCGTPITLFDPLTRTHSSTG